MAAKNQRQVRCSGPMKERVREIAERADRSERYVVDFIIDRYGYEADRLLTSPVRVEPRAATGRRG